MAYTIQPFRPGQAQEVLDLILPIQQIEFGVPITAQDQPDLARIPEVYQRGRGGFWVALYGSRVVGTVGLLDFGIPPRGGGALRKMFLHPDHRGTGLAATLLGTLVNHARSVGVPELWLGTLPQMTVAHNFYERHGFHRVAAEDLPPDFPRMKVDTVFYLLKLNHAPTR